MNADLELPPEMQRVLESMRAQPAPVREMFRYALVLMMVDDEKAHIIGTRLDHGEERIAVRTIAGDEFEIVRPAMSEATEHLLLEHLREIVAANEES